MRLLDRFLAAYRKYGKPNLPPFVQKQFSRALDPALRMRGAYDFWRVRPGVTRLLGPQFHRNRHKVGVLLTYECNLRCHNCDQSSAQAPADTQMTVEQIQRYVDEWVAVRYRWDLMEIAGGEPTLHKDFLEILNILREYRDRYSPHTRIKVLTNGTGERVLDVVSRIPADIEVENSSKGGKRQIALRHSTFNLMPEEIDEYQNVDYKNACEWTERCGTGLGPSGYYHCPVAVGMDRIFEWNIGRQSLPSEDDSMEDLAERFCGKCGWFLKQLEYKKPLEKQYTSSAWKQAYSDYRNRQDAKLVILNGGAPSAPQAVTTGSGAAVSD